MRKILVASLLAVSSLFAVVNINTATKEELMSISGIGEAKADAIIQHRKNTPFKSIDELKNVNGIGDKVFDKIKGDVSTAGKTSIDTDAIKNKKDKAQKSIDKKKSELKDSAKEAKKLKDELKK
ncbi:ComEA family DNA-binding protein [Campylobacter mucosalis]|uniref:Putative ComE family competence protein n=1 Tax=Campylobacter mucosalis CCUG 21559 TaxID=1032067 RepID=A0A6G5QIG9_9BACT|nr:putative ComE family competence protein [Campylobacter mucosalis CCUG 21559]QKF63401.1 competence protein, ComEA family [Campylobacter mucosalis]